MGTRSHMTVMPKWKKRLRFKLRLTPVSRHSLVCTHINRWNKQEIITIVIKHFISINRHQVCYSWHIKNSFESLLCKFILFSDSVNAFAYSVSGSKGPRAYIAWVDAIKNSEQVAHHTSTVVHTYGHIDTSGQFWVSSPLDFHVVETHEKHQ